MRNANLVEWESGREGCLCTNIAVYAYILLFGSLVKYWEANTAADAREMTIADIMVDIEEYIRPVLEFLETHKSAQIEAAFKVPFGSGGPIEYYYRLCKLIKERCPDFVPEGMEKWEEEQSEDRILDTDAKLKEIVSEMRRYIFDVFRVIYGEEKNLYWEKGVTDNGIKADAYKTALDTKAEDRLPLETYLEIVQMKKFVENKSNWHLFKEVFNIPEPGVKGLAKNVKWMKRINELRRIPGHPAKERKYKVEDFEYIDFIYEELMKRIKEAQANPVLEIDPNDREDDD